MVLKVGALVFACHSAACRPPGKNGGTGGSTQGFIPGTARWAAVEAIKSVKTLIDGHMEKYGLPQWGEVEQAINNAGGLVHGHLADELAGDEHLTELRDRLHNIREAHSEPYPQPINLVGLTPEQRQAKVNEYFDRQRLRVKEMIETHELYRQRRAEIITGTMNLYRPMGGELVDIPRHRAPKTGASGLNQAQSSAQTLTYAQRLFPKDWIDASNQASMRVNSRMRPGGRRLGPNGELVQGPDVEVRTRHPLTFKSTSGRAHYQQAAMAGTRRDPGEYDRGTNSVVHSKAVLTLDGEPGTAVHELWHRMEDVHDRIGQVEVAFRDRRAAAHDVGGNLTRISGHGRDELHLPAGLFHDYAGKVYPTSRYTEVGSMGWEYFVTGKTANGKNPDDDHLATVIGIVATIGGGLAQ